MAITAFSFSHSAILRALKSANSDQVDVIPAGYNNNIRWNAGHALVVADSVLSLSGNYQPLLPSNYKDFFNMGTSPADWKEEPPTVEEIISLFEKQIDAAQKLYDTDANTPLDRPFELHGTTFGTLSELLTFLAFHNGMHSNAISRLLKETK